MKALVKSIAALAASAVIATASITSAAFASGAQLYSSVEYEKRNGIWTVVGGYAEVPDMNNYVMSTYLDYSEISFGTVDGPNKQVSKLDANDGYSSNYKWTGVTTSGTKGSSTKYTPENQRRNDTVSAVSDEVGTVKSATYFSTLTAGDKNISEDLEQSMIKVRRG